MSSKKKKAHFSSGTKKGSSSSSSSKGKGKGKSKGKKGKHSSDDDDGESFRVGGRGSLGSFGAGGPMCFGPCGFLTEEQAAEAREREMEDREFRRLNGLPPRWFYTSCDYGYGANCARDADAAGQDDEMTALQCVSAIVSCFSCCLCCFGCYAAAIGL